MEVTGVDFSPAYSEAAGLLLSRVAPYMASAIGGFTDQFYAHLERSSAVAEVIARLLPDEFEQMKAHECDYVMMVVAPDLTMASHKVAALRAGRTHALTGVDMRWLVESLAYYQQRLFDLVMQALPVSADRESILRTISLRQMYDLHEQSAGYHSVRRDVSAIQATIDRVVASTSNLYDLMSGVLQAVGTLPGELSGFFARADERGEIQIEATFGLADRYHQAMVSGQIPRITTDPSQSSGQGPTGRSWRTGNVAVSDSFTLEPDRQPWIEVGKELGFRSSAAVPILDENGRTMATIGLYSSYPGFFSTNRVMRLLLHLREVLSHAALLRMRAPVIPMNERLHYRTLLEHKKAVVHYQPILDLRTGQIDRFEALARLRDSAGTIIPPSDFLNALGETELFSLFTQVLRQAFVDWQRFASDGLRTRMAINIPAQALGDMRYVDAIYAHLDEFGLAPNILVLEVLETQGDGTDAMRYEHFIAQLRSSGIEIEQDDLGSGHSSLVRMDRYPFDAVKIDQELVRGSLRNPQRALEFILYLTRLAHALQTPVTVEGLENLGVIEAAAVLGADRGQGYGIARPMSASNVVEWQQNFRYTVDTERPQTALGAMAAYVMWDRQLAQANRVVGHFVHANGLEGSPLDELLGRSREAADEDMQSPTYQNARAQLIYALRSHWLAANA